MNGGSWPRSREGFVRCICPISPGRAFDVANHLDGIRVAFARQGLHEFNAGDVVIERNVHAWKNEYSGEYLDIVAVYHSAT